MSNKSFTTASNFGHALTNLYIASEDGENSAISPISVFICMYMLKHGANGVTKTELEKALSIEDSNGQEAQDVIKVLTQSSNSQFTLTTANGLFLQVKFDPVAEYVKYLKKNFSAHVQTVAFGTPAGEKIVNDWVEKQTNGKIKDLVKGTTSDTVLALINAVYMKGKWSKEFKKHATYPDQFHVSNTEVVTANFMCQQNDFLYIAKKKEKFALAFFPYIAESAETAWAMGILLPEKGLKPNDFLKFLEPKALQKLYGECRETLLNVKLPKVKVEATIDLIPFFKQLGVQAAFDMEADFSGIRLDKYLLGEGFGGGGAWGEFVRKVRTLQLHVSIFQLLGQIFREPPQYPPPQHFYLNLDLFCFEPQLREHTTFPSPGCNCFIF